MTGQSTEQTATGVAGVMSQVEQLPASAYYWVALGSIGASALLMLMRLRTLSIFVGLWPPTILLLGLFNRTLEPSSNSHGSSGSGRRHMDVVDTMSADSFPASDPPAPPSSLRE